METTTLVAIFISSLLEVLLGMLYIPLLGNPLNN